MFEPVWINTPFPCTRQRLLGRNHYRKVTRTADRKHRLASDKVVQRWYVEVLLDGYLQRIPDILDWVGQYPYVVYVGGYIDGPRRANAQGTETAEGQPWHSTGTT